MSANQSPKPDKDPKVLAGVDPEAAKRVSEAVDGLMTRGKALPSNGHYGSAYVKGQELPTWVAYQVGEDGTEVLSMHRRDDHYMWPGEAMPPDSSDVWEWDIVRHPNEDGKSGLITFRNFFYSMGFGSKSGWYEMQQDAIPHNVDVDPTNGEYREEIIEHTPSIVEFDQHLGGSAQAPTSPLPTVAYPDSMIERFTGAMDNLNLPNQSQ